ncbi:39S ribosomal protein L20, mitochondrial [Sitophilus oryzae]|uniref:Large ribosomal subunit protein bL20m n=1 Tax=Sitophilus oryzae TaxID=7048 RepID=A0A6J2YEZ6_SITOR|nr:39S ribosomal protein L20, mitochondrial [Sitophilus oryzae]
MVFTTAVNFVRSRGPDEFWRKRRIFKLAAHFVGRKRNCYSIAIRYVHRALRYATKGRILKKIDMRNLWQTRIVAGCMEHDIDYNVFRESLYRSDILLDRKTLANLAAWEPYTFKALTDIAKRRAIDDGLASINNQHEVDRIITKGSLVKT